MPERRSLLGILLRTNHNPGIMPDQSRTVRRLREWRFRDIRLHKRRS